MNEHELYREAIQTNIADKERIRAAALNARMKKRRRWPVAVAACLLAAVMATLAVPEARAAVGRWLDSWFMPRDYVRTPREERVPIPELDEAITVLPTPEACAKPSGLSAEAAPEIEVTWVKAGWEEFVNGLHFRFDEILYDGEEILISGELEGGLRYFFADVAEGTDLPFREAIHARGGFELDGQITGGFLEFEYPFANKKFDQSEWEAFLENDKARFAFVCAARYFTITGEQRFDMTVTLEQYEVTHQNEEGTFYKDIPICIMEVRGLHFDATAGAEMDEAIPLNLESEITDTAVELYVTPEVGMDYPLGKVVTKDLSGSRLVLESMRKRLTSAEFTLTLYLNEPLTGREQSSLNTSSMLNVIVDGHTKLTAHGARVWDRDERDKRIIRMHYTNVALLYGDWDEIGEITVQFAYYRGGSYRGAYIEGTDVPIEGASITVPINP